MPACHDGRFKRDFAVSRGRSPSLYVFVRARENSWAPATLKRGCGECRVSDEFRLSPHTIENVSNHRPFLSDDTASGASIAAAVILG